LPCQSSFESTQNSNANYQAIKTKQRDDRRSALDQMQAASTHVEHLVDQDEHRNDHQSFPASDVESAEASLEACVIAFRRYV